MSRLIKLSLVSVVVLSALLTGLASTAARESVTVNLWHTIPPETEVYWLEELMPEFEAAYPECNFVYRNLGIEDPALIRQGLAAGGDEAPAMAWIASSETGAYVEAGVLVDVQGWLDEHPTIRDNIVPSLLELSSYDGEVRSLPWMTNNTAMWINVDAFNEAGVPIPSQNPEETWTWEEFADAVKKLTTDDRKGYLLTQGNAGWDTWVFHAWIAQAGGEFMSPEGDAMFASEAGTEAISFLKELVDGDYVSFTNEGWNAGPWYAGEVAIHTNGPWNLPSLSEFEDFEFTVVPFPRHEKPAANLGGDQLFIFDQGEAKNACSLAYAEYMLSDEFQIKFNIQSGNLPVTTSAITSDEYQAHLETYPFLAGWVNQVPYGVMRRPFPHFADASTFFGQAWDEILLNNAPIQETLETAAMTVDALK